MKHPWTDVLKMIDELAKGKLTQIENPNFFDINVLLYINVLLDTNDHQSSKEFKRKILLKIW